MALAEQHLTERYALYQGDCVEVMRSLPDASIGLSLYSPPFGGLYHYSSDERDLSKTTTASWSASWRASRSRGA